VAKTDPAVCAGVGGGCVETCMSQNLAQNLTAHPPSFDCTLQARGGPRGNPWKIVASKISATEFSHNLGGKRS